MIVNPRLIRPLSHRYVYVIIWWGEHMRKKWVLTISLILILIITGGYIFVKHQQKKDLEATILKTEQPRIEKYLTYNYVGIHDVNLTSTHTNPTGVIHIAGYVNDDPKLTFVAGIYDNHFETALDPTTEAFPLLKNKDRSVKTVSEIEAEESTK